MSDTMALVFKIVLMAAIALAAFATGLGAPKSGPESIWRHPGQFGRALLAILVVVPLWAFAFLMILPLSQVARAGIFLAVLSVGIGPVGGMKLLQGDSPPIRRSFELNVTVLLISIIYVPLMIALLAAAFHRRDLSLGVAAVAKIVLLRALIPLGLGFGLARLRPNAAVRLHRPITLAVEVAVGLLLVLVIVTKWRDFSAVGLGGWVAALGVAAGAVVIGHLMGGPGDEMRAPLAGAAAMRFPALALLLAQTAPLGTRLLPPAVAYIVSAVIAVTVYKRVVQRHGRGTTRPTGPGRHASEPTPA